MIGTKVYELTAEDLLKGMSSSDHINDGGFSNLSEGLNLKKTPGLIRFSAEKTDKTGSDLTDDLIASSGYANTNATPIRAFVDNVGHFYSYDGTTLTLKQTDGTNPTKYKKGFTDMISYGANGEIFTTNEKCIVRWNEGTTFNVTFATFTTQQGVPHPALVYENNVYYGDKNLLLRQTDVAVAPSTILTLSPEQTIIALGVDPGSGRMLISTIEGVNASDTLNKIAKVQYYDGFSNKTLKTVIVDNMITAFYQMGGVVYVGYGQNIGTWDGAGINFLRALDVSLVQEKLPYKQNFSNIDDTLYVIEGNKILAYGSIIAKSAPMFYYAFVNKDGSLIACDLTMLCNLGSGVLGFGWVDQSAVEKFATLDTTSVSTLTNNFVKFYTNKYSFPENITFNAVVVEYGAALPTSNPYADIDIIAIQSNSGLDYGILATTQIAISATNTVSDVYEMSYPFPSITTRSLQLKYGATQNAGIKRISLFLVPYD